MKKEMTLQNNATSAINLSNIWKKTVSMCNNTVTHISAYYSSLVGEKLNNKQTLLIMNAQTAFFMTVFPIECSVYLRIICLIWLITALLQCKNSGIRTSE